MFKVGSKVKAWGVEGVVIGTGVADETYPIWVSFENGEDGRFTRDGKQAVWHKEPSLVLVERAVQFEEVVRYMPICYDYNLKEYLASNVYTTKEEALKLLNAVGYKEVKYFRKVE